LCFRFAVAAPKRQIIPQLIINIDKDSINEPNKANSNENLQQNSQTSAISTNTDSLTASLAASLAITVTQPFLKIQNELENKMNGLLKQFETFQKDNDSKGKNESYEIAKQKIEDDMKNLTEMKLKYIERLQENQVSLGEYKTTKDKTTKIFILSFN
jgi:hypothetical protein